MPRHIKIYTDFDVTNTGVVRNFREDLLPAKVNGKVILSEQEWIKSRRQQSNWETVVQVISLRAQPLNIKTTVTESQWIIEFDVESSIVYSKDDDPLGLLKEDFNNVPLLIGLTEHKKADSYGFIVIDQNMRFETYERKEII